MKWYEVKRMLMSSKINCKNLNGEKLNENKLNVRN